MKVLLVNGSPHQYGCVFTSLSEIAETLQQEGVHSEIFWIGSQAIQGCTACFQCRSGHDGCVFQDKLYVDFRNKMRESDAVIIGAPVYYAGIPGSLCALLDRMFFSAADLFRYKPAAGIVNCRRGGASAAFDRLNKYFTILQMPVVSSQYWNSTHGMTPEELKQDAEGLQTMRTLARNMAYMLKTMISADVPFPEKEELQSTNFIR
ncbi:MAG: flavodoxin family protein [Lentisphaeria bacterium]|jgi:multimeric flavodoxin WrbA|nr:flavodoxin family protein [Lentisphaeria bacterium]